MTRITLEPDSLLQSIPTLLPQGNTVTSASDAIAALIHAINIAIGLKLSSNQQNSDHDQATLPADWNARSPDFTLKYTVEPANQAFTTKIVKLGNKVQIHGVLEPEETSSLEVVASEYVSSTYFQEGNDREQLVHGYVSSDRLAEFTTKYVKDLLRPLLPDLDFEGREEPRGSPPPKDEQPRPSRPPPDNEKEGIKPPSLYQPFNLPSRVDNPLEVGRSDLDPIPNPFADRQPIQPLNPGGGMFVGPGHPIFGQRNPPGQPRPTGPWGGDGYLPPMGAPPGARFDPVGPFGRRPSPGGIPGPRRGGPFSGEPDNDEFMPPGFGGGPLGPSGPSGSSGSFGFGGGHDSMYM